MSPMSKRKLGNISAWQVLFIFLALSFITAKSKWKAYVTTGREEKASTQAKVMITVYGEKGKSAELPLEASKEEGAEKVVHFESGKTNEFPVSIRHFNIIKDSLVRHGFEHLLQDSWGGRFFEMFYVVVPAGLHNFVLSYTVFHIFYHPWMVDTYFP